MIHLENQAYQKGTRPGGTLFLNRRILLAPVLPPVDSPLTRLPVIRHPMRSKKEMKAMAKFGLNQYGVVLTLDHDEVQYALDAADVGAAASALIVKIPAIPA